MKDRHQHHLAALQAAIEDDAAMMRAQRHAQAVAREAVALMARLGLKVAA